MRTSVINYLIDTTRNNPDKTAVTDRNGSYSFSTLLSNACDMASALRKSGAGRVPVGVYLNKSKEMVAAFAGINLAGCFYIPLDVNSPASRVVNILSVLGCKTVISDHANAEKLRAEWTGEILASENIFHNSTDYARAECILAETKPIDTDAVYAIFTSGSTGIPKGVVVSHRGVTDYIDWAVETFAIGASTVIGNQAPFYFDNSTLDIYLMYAAGATLHIIPEEKFIFPATLMDYIDDKRITFIFWVPFVLINVANMDILKNRRPVALKDVFFAGEVMPNKQLNYWRRHLPECRYVNLYGPTEITVDCTYYIVDREFKDDEPLPIGIPCKNTDILILKDRKTPAAANEQGEICVRGSSLAHGYYNNWEKTCEAFIQNPLNTSYPETIYCTGDIGYYNERGEIIFVGRTDSQIKHKGYRIELGEIETAILGTDLVEEGCVIYDHSRQRITLVYSDADTIKPADLRKAVADRIPAYMLPSVLIKEDRLRRNANGKIDRSYYNAKINR